MISIRHKVFFVTSVLIFRKIVLILSYFCGIISLGEFETILTKRMRAKKQNYGRKLKMKRRNSAVFLTRGAIIAAIYVILTYLSSLFGLASGAIQLRLSEALCVLPAFFLEAVPGLFIGCILANVLTGALVWDVVFGSIATLIGAVLGRLIARAPKRFSWLIPFPTVAANTLIVPFVLRYAYGAKDALPFLMLTVGVGEMLGAWVIGLILYHSLKRVFKS